MKIRDEPHLSDNKNILHVHGKRSDIIRDGYSLKFAYFTREKEVNFYFLQFLYFLQYFQEKSYFNKITLFLCQFYKLKICH